ncbi:MAG: hypothetical protein KGM91_12800 [Burkholderiales bacterium]|nr:hypothetical protein [Burkholderiales bacterium]
MHEDRDFVAPLAGVCTRPTGSRTAAKDPPTPSSAGRLAARRRSVWSKARAKGAPVSTRTSASASG